MFQYFSVFEIGQINSGMFSCTSLQCANHIENMQYTVFLDCKMHSDFRRQI
jgi:hypothetical protein